MIFKPQFISGMKMQQDWVADAIGALKLAGYRGESCRRTAYAAVIRYWLTPHSLPSA